mgnify:CR=1 FL=1
MRKIIFKVIKWILLVLILILAVIVVWNYACKRNEAGKVKDAYGQSVEVAGKNMVVDINGEEMKQRLSCYQDGAAFTCIRVFTIGRTIIKRIYSYYNRAVWLWVI